MTPAQQRLKTRHAIVAKLEKRLVNQEKFIPFHRRFQIALQLAALASRGVIIRLEEPDGARAGLLRAIERNIAMLQQIVGCIAVAWRETNADAGGPGDFASVDLERMGKTGDDFLGKFERFVQLGYVCCNDAKFVAADPRDEIGISCAAAEPVRKLGQEFISREMAELVVH